VIKAGGPKSCGLSDDDPIRLPHRQASATPKDQEKRMRAQILSEGSGSMAATSDEVGDQGPSAVAPSGSCSGLSRRGYPGAHCAPSAPQRCQEMDDLNTDGKTYLHTLQIPLSSAPPAMRSRAAKSHGLAARPIPCFRKEGSLVMSGPLGVRQLQGSHLDGLRSAAATWREDPVCPRLPNAAPPWLTSEGRGAHPYADSQAQSRILRDRLKGRHRKGIHPRLPEWHEMSVMSGDRHRRST